jgi:hypothetical protein
MSLTVDTVVSKYIALRDKRSELKKSYEAEDSKYKEAQEKCEAWLLAQANALGVDNFAVKGVGTAIKGKDMKVSCKDWTVFHKFVMETGQLDMFERRISRNVLKSYLEEHGDVVPPGLDVIFEQVVTVRRSSRDKEP